MAETGRLETDPLFLALTRPTMVLGVTYLWAAAEALVFCLYFVNTSNFKGIFYVMVLHSIGVLLCSYEPRFLNILMVAGKTSAKCKNKRYHNNTASYDMY